MLNLIKKLDRYSVYQGGICRVFEGDGDDGGGGGGGEPTSPVNADGTFVENWHNEFGEENAAHLSRYKTFPDLVKSTVETKRKLGKDPDTMVEIPNEHSTDEVRTAFRKAKGVGDSLDDYEYTMPDELSVKLGAVDEVRMTAFKEFAFNELELSPSNFKKLLDFHLHDTASSIDKEGVLFEESKAAAADAAKVELRKQDGWRSEEEYDNKVLIANSVMRKYGGEEAVAEFNAENSPAMTKFLNKIADTMSESTLKGLGAPSGGTKESIKARINENRTKMSEIMKANPGNYKGDPAFRDLDKKNMELYKQMPA